MNGVSRVVSSFLIPIIASLVVVGISLSIFQKYAKAVSLKRIQSRFPNASVIWRTEPTANFFGLKSRSRSQIRGNGVLVLSPEELWFSRFAPAWILVFPLTKFKKFV